MVSLRLSRLLIELSKAKSRVRGRKTKICFVVNSCHDKALEPEPEATSLASYNKYLGGRTAPKSFADRVVG